MLTPRQFLTAGKATLTVLSKKTGSHLTFKVSKGKAEGSPHFVSVMTGSDNETSFTFLGSIFNGADYRHGFRSTISKEAPSAQAFEWLWKNIDAIPEEKAELLPATNCCRCGRKLTHPASVTDGIGPECAGKL